MSVLPRKVFWWSFAAHAAVILSLVIFPLFMNCRMRKKPAEIITYVDLQTVTVPPAPEAAALQPEPPPPPEQPKDIPEPEPVKKKKIELSKKKIKRDELPEPKKKPPALTPAEIKKLLDSGAKLSTGPQPELDLPSWYFALVRQTLYDHWSQPGELAGASGMMTRMQFRISRDGSISRVKMVRPSGSKIMDDSVLAAMNSVKRLKELPSTYREAHYDATVDFELTPGGF